MKKKIQPGGKQLSKYKTSELTGLLGIAGGSSVDPEHTLTTVYLTSSSASDLDYNESDRDSEPPLELF